MLLSDKASAELTRQIEALAPSAATLEGVGFDFQTAQYLAKVIVTGTPDMTELREHGLAPAAAIGICESISKRHARVAAAVARVPEPLPEPVPVAPASDEGVDQEAARSLLHDLCLQIDAEHGDANVLSRAGFTWHTASELAALINSTRT